MDKLKFIKFTVFILTFLLVFGTLSALGSVYKKLNQKPIVSDISTSLKQPIGSTIADYKIENGIIYILVKNGGKSDRILVLDPSSRTTSATITLN